MDHDLLTQLLLDQLGQAVQGEGLGEDPLAAEPAAAGLDEAREVVEAQLARQAPVVADLLVTVEGQMGGVETHVVLEQVLDALAVGAAAATVGIVIGVVTLTGVSFKIAYIVTSTAAGWAGTSILATTQRTFTSRPTTSPRSKPRSPRKTLRSSQKRCSR